MPPNNELEQNKKSKVEKLQQQLYSIDGIKPRERSVLHDKSYDLEDDWHDEDNETVAQLNVAPKKSISFFSILLILAGLFFAGSLTYAGFFFFRGENFVSAENVDISIIGPVSVAGGEKLSLDVVISNNNTIPIELVDLFVEYPDGTKNPDNLSEDMKRTQEDVGSIEAGTMIRRTVSSILFGEESSIKNILFRIQYRVQGSNAVFEKRKNFDIALDAVPVRILVKGLQEISSGQVLELTAEIESNNEETLENLLVTTDYPFGFSYQTATPKPDFNNNIWLIEKLNPKEKKEIKIIGRIEGQNDDSRVFKFNTGLADKENNEKIAVLINSLIHETKIQKSFVDLNIKINDNQSAMVAIPSGQAAKGNLVFSNNTNDVIKNLKIELIFDGAVIDETTVSGEDAFYRSVDNKLVWSYETLPDLKTINPRSSRELGFSFEPFFLGDGKINLQNPEIKISVNVEGIRTSSSDTEEIIESDSVKNIRVISDVVVSNETLYDTGSIENSGPIPPKAEQKTTYSINWSVSNTSNQLEGAKIIATLPSYVAWKDLFLPNNENLIFNPSTRQITWNIGKVNVGDGFIRDPKSVTFKVELFPSISQLGTRPELVKDIKFYAQDTFTDYEIYKELDANTTYVQSLRNNTGHAEITK